VAEEFVKVKFLEVIMAAFLGDTGGQGGVVPAVKKNCVRDRASGTKEKKIQNGR
jgi:hypothetical protein